MLEQSAQEKKQEILLFSCLIFCKFHFSMMNSISFEVSKFQPKKKIKSAGDT